MENDLLLARIFLGVNFSKEQPVIQTDMQSKVTFVPAGSAFVDLKQQRKTENVSDLHVHPDVEEVATTKNMSYKAFVSEGPTLQNPVQDLDPFGKFGVLERKNENINILMPVPFYTGRSTDSFIKGQVRQTGMKALKQMVDFLPVLTEDTHGCLIDEDLDPECNMYVDGIHFLSEMKLGKGSYGEVDLCIDSKSNKRFVKKKIQKDTLRTSEINVPINLSHPNVTRFLGLIQRPNINGELEIELLLEYGGVALHQYLVVEGNVLTQTQVWDLTRQSLHGLSHLDYYSMVHLDIKPENLCVLVKEKSLQLKITDFGSAKLSHEPIQFIGWTPEYMAPESCKLFLQKSRQVDINWNFTETDITGKADVFAMGLVVMFMYKKYHLLMKLITKGKITYKGVSDAERKMMQFQLMISLAADVDFVHNLIPDECDLDMRELLMKMTQHDYKQRYSAKQAVEFIEARDKRIRVALLQNHQLEQYQQQQLRVRQQNECLPTPEPTVTNLSFNDPISQIIEDENYERGPIKNSTMDKLRHKIKPYFRFGKVGYPGKTETRDIASKSLASKCMMSPYNEMIELDRSYAPSKTMMQPETPVLQMTGLSLHQPETVPVPTYHARRGQKSETMMNPVTQPQAEVEQTSAGTYFYSSKKIKLEKPDETMMEEESIPAMPVAVPALQQNVKVPAPALMPLPGVVKTEQQQEYLVNKEQLFQLFAQIKKSQQTVSPAQPTAVPVAAGNTNKTWGNEPTNAGFNSVSVRQDLGHVLGQRVVGRRQADRVLPPTQAVKEENEVEMGNIPNFAFL